MENETQERATLRKERLLPTVMLLTFSKQLLPVSVHNCPCYSNGAIFLSEHLQKSLSTDFSKCKQPIKHFLM